MIRRALLAGVRFYRRRLSGRGPFAGVRCTFAAQESCAAYAERILGETPSAWTDLGRIRRRLVRCRHLSLYRLREERLGWGKAYDQVLACEEQGVRQLDDLLAADGEGLPVRAAVHRATARVAHAAGQADGAWRTSGTGLPLVRDAEAVRRALTHRLHRRGLMIVVAAGLGTVACFAGWSSLLVVICLLVTPALVQMGTIRGQLRRLDWLDVLASLEGPGQELSREEIANAR